MQRRILFESSFEGIRESTLLRDGRSLTNLATAVMACVAMFIYAFALPDTHAPSLHAAASVVADSVHSHDHGDHSHDDRDIVADDTGVSDHHHADHTHEKAGLSEAIAYRLRNVRETNYTLFVASLLGEPPEGIDRPPRTVNLS